jgi:hypothetical protein
MITMVARKNINLAPIRVQRTYKPLQWQKTGAQEMRNIFICIFAAPAAGNSLAQESLRPDRPVAFVGGMLLDGYEAEPIHHSVVIFENGRITTVGSKLDNEIPDNVIIIDGNPLANIVAMQHVDIVVKDGGIWYAESAAHGPVTKVGHAF